MGRRPKPRQRSFAPLESQHWLSSILCSSPPSAALPVDFYGFAMGTNRYDGALPQTPPKELRPFGIPAMAILYLVLLAAFGGIDYGLYGFAVGYAVDDGAPPQTPPKELRPFGNPAMAISLT